MAGNPLRSSSVLLRPRDRYPAHPGHRRRSGRPVPAPEPRVAGSLAPEASHLVYFGPDTDRVFVETLAAAIYATPTPTAVSIGWGASEDAWTPQARASVNQLLADAAALGITVCVAAGDGGSESGQGDAQSPHVTFPRRARTPWPAAEPACPQTSPRGWSSQKWCGARPAAGSAIPSCSRPGRRSPTCRGMPKGAARDEASLTWRETPTPRPAT